LTAKLDGYNVWPAITRDSETPRKEVLLNLNPPSEGFIGQAAMRVGDWKLIIGQPNCSMGGHEPIGDGCPDGWVHLDGSIDRGPYTPSLTWLFNVKEDPNERRNLAEEHPDIVKMLKERIEFYNFTHIVQLNPPLDPGGVWTPWLD